MSQRKKPIGSFFLTILITPVNILLSLLARLERFFYFLRELLWSYPDILFFQEGSLRAKLQRLYEVGRPYTHLIFSGLVVSVIAALLVNPVRLPVFAEPQQRFVEAVVMGTDEQGRVQQLPKINPLLASSIQLEKDLSQLIYEPLIRFRQDGSVDRVLAAEILRLQEGAEYEFTIRDDVTWHDGSRLRVEDVIATLELVKEFDVSRNSELDSAFVQAVKQMAWERTGEYSIRICTQAEDAATVERPCTGVDGDKPIFSNFLELISIKIMPAAYLDELNTVNINSPEPRINRFPVGTGPFRYQSAQENRIILAKNDAYYREVPELDVLEFRLFSTEDSAMQALQNGEVHALSTVSTENLRKVNNYPQLRTMQSSVLQNQYWGLYFNLRKDPDGNAIGSPAFQDKRVRQAVTHAIDKERILEVLLGAAEEAYGPIHPDSDFFHDELDWPSYDIAKAAQLLEQAGWKVAEAGQWREKDGERFSFTLSFTDNPDRRKVAETIRQDLAAVGVEVVLEPRSQEELLQQQILPKLFDTVLYGVSTFSDPDRYELFHSEEELLNLSSYVGSEETAKIENRETVRLPKVDRLLELGRSYDPLEAKDERLDTYRELQRLISDDAPLVFLYHPKFIYYVNDGVSGIDLSTASSLEERFVGVEDWGIN